MATPTTPTPPPASSLRTPQTPRFGYDDSYEPYSPRKSTRVSQRLRDAKTPPPHPSGHNLRKTSQSTPPQTTPRSSRRSAATRSPSSPQTATKKLGKVSPSEIGGRRVSGALNFDSAVTAAVALGLPTPTPKRHHKMDSTLPAPLRTAAMLPTPAKTPKKRPTETAPAIKAIARNLFPVHSGTNEEIMPSPKKNRGRKRYTGYTLDSFEAVEEDMPIPIYTDSHDRVPEVDMSQDNPFFGQGSVAHLEPSKVRASKRRKIMVPGEGEQSIEDLEQRKDGMIYTFRGKKIFRKFDDVHAPGLQDEEEEDDDAQMEGALPSTPRRPLTRSSIKPRLLFPGPDRVTANGAPSYNTEDEEADTDIEEQDVGLTPIGRIQVTVATPKAPKFAPASPPATVRTTRSKDINNSLSAPTSDNEAEPTSPSRPRRGRSGRVSPFDSWSRKKTAADNKKRSGSPSVKRGGAKKLRA